MDGPLLDHSLIESYISCRWVQRSRKRQLPWTVDVHKCCSNIPHPTIFNRCTSRDISDISTTDTRHHTTTAATMHNPHLLIPNWLSCPILLLLPPATHLSPCIRCRDVEYGWMGFWSCYTGHAHFLIQQTIVSFEPLPSVADISTDECFYSQHNATPEQRFQIQQLRILRHTQFWQPMADVKTWAFNLEGLTDSVLLKELSLQGCTLKMLTTDARNNNLPFLAQYCFRQNSCCATYHVILKND